MPLVDPATGEEFDRAALRRKGHRQRLRGRGRRRDRDGGLFQRRPGTARRRRACWARLPAETTYGRPADDEDAWFRR